MDMATIGDILRKRIRDCGFTQKEFAEKACIGKATLTKQMNGTIAYRYDDLIKYAELLDCSYDYLLGYSNSPKRENADIVDKTGLTAEAAENLVVVQNMKILDFVSNEAKTKTIEYIESYQKLISIIICDENFLSDMLLYFGSNKPLQRQIDEMINHLTKDDSNNIKGIIENNMDKLNLASLMGDIERIKMLLHPELLEKMKDDIKKVHRNLKAIPTQAVVKADE